MVHPDVKTGLRSAGHRVLCAWGAARSLLCPPGAPPAHVRGASGGNSRQKHHFCCAMPASHRPAVKFKDKAREKQRRAAAKQKEAARAAAAEAAAAAKKAQQASGGG